MQDPPNVSASELSEDDKNLAYNLEHSLLQREAALEAVRRSDLDGLRGAAFYNKTWYLSMRYCSATSRYSVWTMEPFLHDLWHDIYQCAMNLDHKSAEHDRLVLDVVRSRGRGPLTRPVQGVGGQGNDSFEIAKTSDGVLWEDLPFLVTDMTNFWLNDCAKMGASQRRNLAAFLAKLASTGLVNKVYQIALLLFRDVFETERPIGSLNEPGDADANPDRTMNDLSIAALLPAACAWFSEAQDHIIRLTDLSWNDCSDAIGQGGATFTQSELGQRSSSAGFSPSRWMYWMERLEEISQEAAQAGEMTLMEEALETRDHHLGKVEEADAQLLRVFPELGDIIDKANEAIEARFWEKHPNGPSSSFRSSSN